MDYAWTGVPTRTAKTYEGVIVNVEWDRHAWTLTADVGGSGRRLIQVPAYAAEPRPGDRIRLEGRHPVVGIRINDVDVYPQAS